MFLGCFRFLAAECAEPSGLLRLKISGLLKLTALTDEPSGLLRLKTSGLP